MKNCKYSFARFLVVLWPILAISTATCVSAQDEGEEKAEITLQELSAPASPAFVLLDIEPTSIERPKTPKALTVNLLSAVGTSGDLIPENFSVEFAPYWLVNHPKLTYDKYLKGVGRTLLQTLSISVATTTAELDGMSGDESMDTTRLGLGVRGQLVGGRVFSKEGNKTAADHAKVKLDKANAALLDAIIAEEDESLEKKLDRHRSKRACWVAFQGRLVVSSDSQVGEVLVDLGSLKAEYEQKRQEVRDEVALAQSDLDAAKGKEPKDEVEVKKKKAKLERKLAELEQVESGIDCKEDMIDFLEARRTLELTEILMQAEVRIVGFDRLISAVESQDGGRLEKTYEKAVAEVERATKALSEALGAFGFSVDFATAGTWRFEGENKDVREFEKWGAWLTPAYRFERKDRENGKGTGKALVDILAVGRYIKEEISGEDAVDLGARLIYHANKDLAISAELIERNGDQNLGDGSRWAVISEYRASKSAYLVASYGRNFPKDGGDGALISTLGLRLAFGKDPSLLEPSE